MTEHHEFVTKNLAIPIRMCVICRRRFAKKQLSRHILDCAGLLKFDERKEMPGRGWYCCTDPLCREKFEKFKPKLKIHKSGKATGK